MKGLTKEERFWSHVDKNGPVPCPELGPCWEWTASLQEKGYGQFHIVESVGQYKSVRAHRFAYELVYGPTDKNILHRCDNRKCVNARHLFVGTHTENMRDMCAKGRHRWPVKLVEWQVSLIKLFLANERSHRQLAKQFGVGKSTIGSIATGDSWPTVQKWRSSEMRFTPEMWRSMGGRLGLNS